MKINADFIKTRMGEKWVAVATRKTEDGFSGIIELNQTASDIWDMIDEGLDEEQIATKIAKECAVPQKDVLSDVKETIKSFTLYGIVISETKGYPERCLTLKGEFRSTAYGDSMTPLLKGGRDEVCIVPFTSCPKKYDIVLYRRADKLVLHRIVRILKDGRYVLRGDNSFYTEISDGGNFIGVLSEYRREGKVYKTKGFKYAFYSYKRVHSFNLRRILAKLTRKRDKK